MYIGIDTDALLCSEKSVERNLDAARKNAGATMRGHLIFNQIWSSDSYFRRASAGDVFAEDAPALTRRQGVPIQPRRPGQARLCHSTAAGTLLTAES